MDASDWIAIGSVCATTFVAVFALSRQERSTKTQWLDEQRRVAYVDLLSSTRVAYEARIQPGPEARVRTSYAREAEVDATLNAAKHAAAVVRIVGPDKIADLADAVLARVRLDRPFYSPTRSEQLAARQDHALDLAAETQNRALVAALQTALRQDPVDTIAYERAHADHRLDSFWRGFTDQANHVLGADRPVRNAGRAGARSWLERIGRG